MMKKNFRTCIACDEPLEQEGFNLLVCGHCDTDSDDVDAGHPAARSRVKDADRSPDADGLAGD